MNERARTPRFEEAGQLFPGEGERQATSLLSTLRLLRRRWVILAAVCAGTTALFLASGLVRAPSYRSEATLEVGPDRPAVSHDPIDDSSARSSPLWDQHFRTQETLLRRPGLLAGVLQSLTPDKVEKYRRSAEPVRALSEDLEIDAVPSTFLIKIALIHDRPDNGPEIVNRLVALFLEDSNRQVRELNTRYSEALGTESLPVLRQKLSDAERELRVFDEERGYAVSRDRHESLLEAARKIGGRRTEVRLRAIELRASPAPRAEDLADSAVASSHEPDAPGPRAAALPALETELTALELELARQRASLKDRHPTILAIQGRLEALSALIKSARQADLDRRQRAAESASQKRERELSAAALEERALDEEESRLDERIAKVHELVGQRQKLEAEVAATRDLLNSYLKRHGELEAMSGAGLPSVRVVELARDPQPLRSRHALHLMLGLVVGLTLGALAVLVAEQLDDRIMNPPQAEAALGLDLLGSIPRLTPATGPGNLPCVPDPVGDSAAMEPFRRLRSEIAARLEGKPEARILAVLSAKYGEGKSSVAINLARVLALEGRRVLLLDADLRRPGLKPFLTNPRAPGLEEHLRGGLDLKRCIQQSRIAGVHLLAPSAPIEGSAELAGSARFAAMGSHLRSEYDFVVVDTSPIEAASEAAVIAAGADASILVVEERRTRAGEAARARRRLESHHVRVLGLVVNRSQSGAAPRFESTRVFLSVDRVSGERNAFLEVG